MIYKYIQFHTIYINCNLQHYFTIFKNLLNESFSLNFFLVLVSCSMKNWKFEIL